MYEGLQADSWLQIREEKRESPQWLSWSLIGHLISWRPDCTAALGYLRDYLTPNYFCLFYSLPVVKHWPWAQFMRAYLVSRSFSCSSLSFCATYHYSYVTVAIQSLNISFQQTQCVPGIHTNNKTESDPSENNQVAGIPFMANAEWVTQIRLVN